MDDSRKILVTGASGFVGSAIVRALLGKHPQWTVIALDMNEPTASSSSVLDVKFVKADVTVSEQIQGVISDVRPDAVIHTAGMIPGGTERYSRRLEKETLRVNVEGTRNMLNVSRAAGCKVFVYTSSCTIVTDDWRNSYPNIDESWPVSPRSSIYGESKVQAEALVLEANSNEMVTCALRPAVIFGEGDRQLIPAFHACIAKGETPFIIGNGLNLWDTVYVGNVADSHVLAVENLLSSKSAAGEVFFIQNNEPIPFRDFQLAVWKSFGHYPRYEMVIPEGLCWLLGLLVEVVTWIFGTTATLSRGSVYDACAVRYASGEKARKVLGFIPRVRLQEAIERSCDDYSRRLSEDRVFRKSKQAQER